MCIRDRSSSYEWTDNDLTKMTLPTGASYTYSYDGHHNVTSASSATGVQSSFGYTAKGLNTSVKAGPASKPIESNATYDAFSRVSSITLSLIHISSPDGPEILGEVLERRTEDAKEFRRADGSRQRPP